MSFHRQSFFVAIHQFTDVLSTLHCTMFVLQSILDFSQAGNILCGMLYPVVVTRVTCYFHVTVDLQSRMNGKGSRYNGCNGLFGTETRQMIVLVIISVSTTCPKVWRKVIFSRTQACVSHSVQRVVEWISVKSLYDITSCLAAWSHVPSGCSLSGGSCLGVSVQGVSVKGVSVSGGSLSRWISVKGVCVGRPVKSVKQAVRILLKCFLVCKGWCMYTLQELQ